MDFCRTHSPDENWTLSHEQYRPFVMFHRIQAAAFAVLEDDQGAELAIEEINQGLESLRNMFEDFGAAERFDDEELVQQLSDLREELRKKYRVGMTLSEKLADAVAREQYELAAKLRDELDRKQNLQR